MLFGVDKSLIFLAILVGALIFYAGWCVNNLAVAVTPRCVDAHTGITTGTSYDEATGACKSR